jgi:hypothetical protein
MYNTARAARTISIYCELWPRPQRRNFMRKSLADRILEWANTADVEHFLGDPTTKEFIDLLYKSADYMDRADKFISYYKNIPAAILKEDYCK